VPDGKVPWSLSVHAAHWSNLIDGCIHFFGGLATVKSFLAASPMQAPILLLLTLDSFAVAAADVVFPDNVCSF
jgi:hypothetical protein